MSIESSELSGEEGFSLQLPRENMTIRGAYSFQVSFDDSLGISIPQNRQCCQILVIEIP